MSLNTDSATVNDSIQDQNLDNITELFDNLNQNSKEIKDLLKKQDLISKDLEKKYKSLEKKLKTVSKKKKSSGNSGGLSIPIKISNELKKMLDLESDVSSRSEITKLISVYIKNNNLKNTEEGKKKYVIPNADFKNLLKKKTESDELISLSKEELNTLTHMNYQKYFQHNFIKI
jgi:hypothetical protein